MRMKTLYLVRHGEAGDDRIEQVSYSAINEYDKPLTQRGIEQSIKLNTVFDSISIDRSYTSDYLRAKETFAQLNIASNALFELADIRELYCECIGKNLGNTDIEEFKLQKQRVLRFIETHLLRIADGETVLIVAHGCFILYLLKQLIGKSFGHDMTHTGVTKLVFENEWDFEYFNHSSHLQDAIEPEISVLFE
ncbi:hypothetical protein ST37_16510 [Vibrio sp. qd031]|nr:hypothetical protein ST37_16510 [Vibrio sp. qd031]